MKELQILNKWLESNNSNHEAGVKMLKFYRPSHNALKFYEENLEMTSLLKSELEQVYRVESQKQERENPTVKGASAFPVKLTDIENKEVAKTKQGKEKADEPVKPENQDTKEDEEEGEPEADTSKKKGNTLPVEKS